MTVTKTLTSAAVAASIIGAIGLAVAQTSTESPATPGATSTEPMPNQSPAPATAAPSMDTAPQSQSPAPSADSTTPPSQDAAAPDAREPKADRN